MTRLDRLWTLEWEHESNSPLQTKSILTRAGVLRHIVQEREYHSWACEITLEGEVEHLDLFPDHLRQIDDGLTQLAYGRRNKHGLVDLVRFAQHFPQLFTEHIPNPLPGDSLEALLANRERLVRAGAIRANRHGWEVDIWHPQLRKQRLVRYDRRGKTLHEELEGYISTGWGRVIGDVLHRPIVSLETQGDGITSASLALVACGERLLGRSLGTPLELKHHQVRVQEVVGLGSNDVVIKCANLNRLGGELELLIEPSSGKYIFLNLDVLARSRMDLRIAAFHSIMATGMVTPFEVDGAVWTPLENVTNWTLEGVLKLNLPVLRRTMPEMFLSEGTYEVPLS